MSNASAYAELENIRRKLGALASDRVRVQLHQRLAEESLTLIARGFKGAISPYGIPWQPNKSNTATLYKSGRLMRSFRRRLTVRGFSITTRVVYADTHQYGRPQGRGRIPARPFMPEPKNNPVLPDAWRRVFDAAAEAVVHPYIT